MTRPANTVGGDFYDIQPLRDGRVVIALGDVSGKGSPAALLMALLLAMFRTLVPSIEEENLEPSELAARLERPGVAACAGQPLHHAVLRRVHAAQRRAALRQRRTHAAPGPQGRRRHRSTHRRRDCAGNVRAVHLPHRAGAPRTRRSRGRVQRRDHRGREPDRQAVRRARPRNCPAERPVGRPGRPRKRALSALSNSTPETSGSPTISRSFCFADRPRQRSNIGAGIFRS